MTRVASARDPDYDNIRDHPRFQRLVKTFE
jgi:hypothetical protein